MKEEKVSFFICGTNADKGIHADHICDDEGPTVYGGDDVPMTLDVTKAGRGYSWGSVTCSKCRMPAMYRDVWKDWA